MCLKICGKSIENYSISQAKNHLFHKIRYKNYHLFRFLKVKNHHLFRYRYSKPTIDSGEQTFAFCEWREEGIAMEIDFFATFFQETVGETKFYVFLQPIRKRQV